MLFSIHSDILGLSTSDAFETEKVSYVHKTVACCGAKINIVDVDAKLSETCNKWYDKMINISSAKIRSFYRNPIFHIPLPGDAMKVIRGEHLDMPLNPKHPSFPYQTTSYPE